MTGVNVYNVREANNWLKKMGVNNVLKFSTRTDRMYGKVYVLSEIYNGNQTRMIVKSPGLGECVETAYMVIKRMGR